MFYLEERETERERVYLLIHPPNVKCPVAKNSIWVTHNLHHPHRWQGTKYLSHHLLFARMHINRKLELGAKPGLEPGYFHVGCWHFNWHLNCYTKPLSPLTCFKTCKERELRKSWHWGERRIAFEFGNVGHGVKHKDFILFYFLLFHLKII